MTVFASPAVLVLAALLAGAAFAIWRLQIGAARTPAQTGNLHAERDADRRERMTGQRIPCAFCGYPVLGGFGVRIPHHPHGVMHSISCGPAFYGVAKMAEPTHRRSVDGQIEKIGAS